MTTQEVPVLPTRPRRSSLLAALIASVALVVAACGSTDSTVLGQRYATLELDHAALGLEVLEMA
jgi:hypothetical protein